MNKKVKRIAAVFAAAAIVGTGAAEAVSHIPSPQGSNDSVITKVDVAVHAAGGTTPITSFLPPAEAKLLQNNTTSKELLTALKGAQSAVAQAQTIAGATAQQQQDLTTASKFLDTIIPVVQSKGEVPDSQLAGVIALDQNKAKYAKAFEDLGKDLLAGTPVGVTLAQALTSNPNTLKAIGEFAGAAVASSPEAKAFVKNFSLNAPEQAKLAQDITLLKTNFTNKNLLTALDAAQSAVSTAQQSPQATPQQQKDLATVSQLLDAAAPILQNKGSIPASDMPAIEKILQNKQEYGQALLALYKDYKAGDPATAAFAKAFESNDPALVKLAQTFLSNPTAINGIEQQAGKALTSNNGSIFRQTGISPSAQKKLISSLPGPLRGPSA